jgi:hypothetical protein
MVQYKEGSLTPRERLLRRATEIETHAVKTWGSLEAARLWWPEAIQHALDLRWALEGLDSSELSA